MLYLGALGDRYGRKMMLLLGMALSVPACLLAAFAPIDGVLFAARVLGGVSAGMAYPTTLALITALWSGPGRTKSIALWSALGGGIAALGPLIAGALLEHFGWGSVFLITLPLVVVALVMALVARPEPRQRDDRPGRQPRRHPVGRAGRRRSILAINFAPVPNKGALALGSAADRARRADRVLHPAASGPKPRCTTSTSPARRIFWVAACAGIIVFGSLMARDVREPAVPAERARLLDARGRARRSCRRSCSWSSSRRARPSSSRRAAPASRCSAATSSCCSRFLSMLLLWNEDTPYWQIGARLRVHRHRRRVRRHAGLALAHRLGARAARRDGVRHRRPAARPRRRDHAVDLRRAADRRLRGGVSTAIGSASDAQHVTDSIESQLTKSFAGAETIAEQYPQYASQITAAAKQSFLDGDQWAYTAGLVAVLLGAALVFFLFPKKHEEQQLLAQYHAEDTVGAPDRPGTPNPGGPQSAG